MHVHIFWDAQSPAGLQMPVSRKISAILGVPTTVSENHVRMMGYVTERRQIDAAALLDSIQTYKHRHGIEEPVLLVVHQDLFKQGSSFVFGLARESVLLLRVALRGVHLFTVPLLHQQTWVQEALLLGLVVVHTEEQEEVQSF